MSLYIFFSSHFKNQLTLANIMISNITFNLYKYQIILLLHLTFACKQTMVLFFFFTILENLRINALQHENERRNKGKQRIKKPNKEQTFTFQENFKYKI
jgi:hypothetical protein